MPDGPRHFDLPDGRSVDLWAEGPIGAPVLLFVPGTPSAGLPFPAHVAAAADRGLRLVSWSRPGYGASTRHAGRDVVDVAVDAEAILDGVRATDCVVIGWSGGGPHALAIGARLPTRVRAVATIGGVAPYPAEGLDWLDGMGRENVEEFEAALDGEATLITFKERAWPVLREVTAAEVDAAFGDLIDEVDRGALRGQFTEWLAALFREGLRDGYLGWLDDDMAFTRPWGFDLAELRVPVHVWQGGHDRMVPFAHGAWLAERIPTAVPHLLPEEGHLTLVVDAFPQILDHLLSAEVH